MDPITSSRRLYAACFAFASANNGHFPRELPNLTPRFLSDYIPTKWSNGCTLHYIAGQGTTSHAGRVLFFTDKPVEGRHFLTYTIDGKEELMSESDLRQKLTLQKKAIEAERQGAQPTSAAVAEPPRKEPSSTPAGAE